MGAGVTPTRQGRLPFPVIRADADLPDPLGRNSTSSKKFLGDAGDVMALEAGLCELFRAGLSAAV